MKEITNPLSKSHSLLSVSYALCNREDNMRKMHLQQIHLLLKMCIWLDSELSWNNVLLLLPSSKNSCWWEAIVSSKDSRWSNCSNLWDIQSWGSSAVWDTDISPTTNPFWQVPSGRASCKPVLGGFQQPQEGSDCSRIPKTLPAEPGLRRDSVRWAGPISAGLFPPAVLHTHEFQQREFNQTVLTWRAG